MGRLDVSFMRHMTRDEFRVLTAVEMGMKNHSLVPLPLIVSIAQVKTGGGVHKAIRGLLANRLLCYDAQAYEGYRLTYTGYDVLALKALTSRGIITALGRKIGVGKESDIHTAMTPSGEEVVVKLHRLGRTSFRAVKRKRDYLRNRSASSWLYLSRLAAMREYAFMRALHAQGFSVPTPKDQNRHVVVMSLAAGYPMYQIRAGEMAHPERVLGDCLKIAVDLARHGLVHCDLNEFNLIVDENEHVVLIDFPQMISVSHRNAEELFDRDVGGVVKFFRMKQRFPVDDEMLPRLPDVLREVEALRQRDALEKASKAENRARAAAATAAASNTPAEVAGEAPDFHFGAPQFLALSAGEGVDEEDDIDLDSPGLGLGLGMQAPEEEEKLELGSGMAAVPVRLDVEVKASGFTDEDEEMLRQAILEQAEASDEESDADDAGEQDRLVAETLAEEIPDAAGGNAGNLGGEAGDAAGDAEFVEMGTAGGEAGDDGDDGDDDVEDSTSDAGASSDAEEPVPTEEPGSEIMAPSSVNELAFRRGHRGGGKRRGRGGKGAAGVSRAKPNTSKMRSKGRMVHRPTVDKYHDDAW